MKVTANQLRVSACNRSSSGCTSNEKWLSAVQYTMCQPFSSNVQPDDGLLEAETCSWLAVTIIRCNIYLCILYSIVVFLTF
jgi:hypothetical protein